MKRFTYDDRRHATVDASKYAWLKEELMAGAHAFAATLRPLDGNASIPRFTWNVGELGAHVAMMPYFYRTMAATSGGYPVPDDLDTLARHNMAQAGTFKPTELADIIDNDFGEWVDELGDDPTRPMNWWVPATVSTVAGAALGEVLLHRHDLASVTTDTIPAITRDQAIAILRGTIHGGPAFVNKDVASKAAGTYHLHLRGGGGDFTMRITDGALTVQEGKPQKADVHFHVSPVSMLKASYGRENPFVAALLGRQLMWGRKPWLGLRFANLIEGI